MLAPPERFLWSATVCRLSAEISHYPIDSLILLNANPFAKPPSIGFQRTHTPRLIFVFMTVAKQAIPVSKQITKKT